MSELDFGHRVIDVADGRDRVTDEAIGGNRAVVIGQPRVVGTNHCPIYVGILDAFEKARCEHRWEQHLGIEAVFVLFTQALLCRPRAVVGRAVGLVIRTEVEADRPAAGDVLPVLQHGHAFDQPAFAAVFELHETRRSVGPLLGHVLVPERRCLDVSVARDHFVVASHVIPP